MRNILIYIVVLACGLLYSCQDVAIGYLKADNAEYIPDSLIVRTVLDPVLDKNRIDNQAPWVTLKIQGVLGTAPIYYELLDAKSEDGNVELFKEVLNVRGGGIMEVPLDHNLSAGRYTVSLRVYNKDHSANLVDAFTFIVQ